MKESEVLHDSQNIIWPLCENHLLISYDLHCRGSTEDTVGHTVEWVPTRPLQHTDLPPTYHSHTTCLTPCYLFVLNDKLFCFSHPPLALLPSFSLLLSKFRLQTFFLTSVVLQNILPNVLQELKQSHYSLSPTSVSAGVRLTFWRSSPCYRMCNICITTMSITQEYRWKRKHLPTVLYSVWYCCSSNKQYKYKYN